jgi:hypothetical protein
MSKCRHGISAVLNYALNWVDDRDACAPPEDIRLFDPSLDSIGHLPIDIRQDKLVAVRKMKMILRESLLKRGFVSWRHRITLRPRL